MINSAIQHSSLEHLLHTDTKDAAVTKSVVLPILRKCGNLSNLELDQSKAFRSEDAVRGGDLCMCR